VTLAALIGVVGSVVAPTMAQAARGHHSPPHRSNLAGLHVSLVDGRRYGVKSTIHVVRFNEEHFTLKIGLAKNALDGGVETPSSLCRSTRGCVAAVNGDFFDMTPPGVFDPGDDVGGIIQNCVLLHTPEISHQQADIDAHSVSQGLEWSSTIDVNGVIVQIAAINQELPLSYTGVHLALSGDLLFTPPYALATPAGAGRMTYVFRPVTRATRPTTINSTVILRLVARSRRAIKVTAGHVDISAPPGSSFATLSRGDTVAMTTLSSAGCNNIGGHPILLDHGLATPIVAADTYMAKPYARTVVGWTASGETVLMTVDGVDGVSGATAPQLVRVLRSLKVVTALDLDGGNSTALYALGRVLNHPSQGKERPVSTSLLVVRTH
jgi:exopolysaccharide biosynthesis protein